MNKNKFGLSRSIPENIKREVRQRCGFGCIICGSLIIEYEHIDPEFHNAEKHESDKITLLCPKCHAKVTKGLLSKEEIKNYNKDPFCKKHHLAKDSFLENSKSFHKVIFAGNQFFNCPIPIKVKDLPLIKITKDKDDIFLLSANFFNSKGKKSLEIIDNEWIVSDGNWDFECKGNSMIVRDEKRNISLKLVIESPNTLIIKQVKMRVYNYYFEGDERELLIKSSNLNITIASSIADNCEVGFQLS